MICKIDSLRRYLASPRSAGAVTVVYKEGLVNEELRSSVIVSAKEALDQDTLDSICRAYKHQQEDITTGLTSGVAQLLRNTYLHPDSGTPGKSR